MKLPTHLFGQYRQYKNFTSLFVGWVLDTLNDDIKTTIKKHKKRKGKKHSNSKNNNNNNNNINQNEKPSISELYEMSQQIKVLNITTPDWVLAVLQKIIQNRSLCAKFYLSMHNSSSEVGDNEDVEFKEQNQSHQHILDVFKKIFVELGGNEYLLRRGQLYKQKENEQTSSNQEFLKNQFDGLDIEDELLEKLNMNDDHIGGAGNDIDEWLPDNMKKTKPTSKSTKKKKSNRSKFGVKDDDSSSSFAVWCFFL